MLATSNSSQLMKTSATHSWSVASIVDSAWALFSDTLTSVAAPLNSLAQAKIISALNSIRTGHLTIHTSDQSFHFGTSTYASGDLQATLHVRDNTFWTRVALFEDVGFAESYMFGDVDCDDMSSLMKILILNRDEMAVNSLASSILSSGRSLTGSKFIGSLTNSRANISAHYDLGNEMFEAFLSPDMNYSCAIWEDINEDIREKSTIPWESLESAQTRKMRTILNRINIQPGNRVLEIGTGWGSLAILAILAAQTEPTCTIDSVTLSSEQRDLAMARIEAAGLSHRITVHLCDFREIVNKPEWKGAFDRYISIEMIEHVGKPFFNEYWNVIDWALNPKTGSGIVQSTTIAESRAPAYDQGGADFIQKWIFPGGYIPAVSFMVKTMNNGLTVDSITNIGPHYARTLREWKRNFLAEWTSKISPSLVKMYSLDEAGLEIFRRKWVYYFDYCEAAFVTRTLGVHIITFTREGNSNFSSDL